ncbi:MAG: TRAP transporter small permease subunit [Caldilineaceae bacterium]|nr:TRAP transporter small permease subunit [Caldilineaceae bacterium]
MRLLGKYVQFIDVLTERIGWLSMLIAALTVLVGFYNVVARFVGRYIGVQLSSNMFIELQWYMFSLVFFLSFAYILKNGINVRVDFIYANWSKQRKATLDFWGHLVFLVPFCVMGIWFTINPVLASWGRLPNGGWGPWEMSPDPNGLPRAPIKSMIIVAFVLLLLQTISELIKLYAIMRDQEGMLGIQRAEIDAPLRIE